MIIRHTTLTEFEPAIEWAKAEGWNPGLDDLLAFHHADPQGFLIGSIDQTPVASISVVKYGQDFGFLGFYIVASDKREQGLGLQIWNAGMDYLNARTIGLDGVVEQQSNYAKAGFALAHTNIRYCGNLTSKHPPVANVMPVSVSNFSQIAEFDRLHFGADRKAFLYSWLFGDASRTSFIYRDEGRIAGLGTIRKCYSGYKIGPLFAESPGIAKELLLCLADKTNGADLFLDIPQPNRQAVLLAEELSFSAIFETARMYRGQPPNLPLDQIYGITSFELG